MLQAQDGITPAKMLKQPALMASLSVKSLGLLAEQGIMVPAQDTVHQGVEKKRGRPIGSKNKNCKKTIINEEPAPSSSGS